MCINSSQLNIMMKLFTNMFLRMVKDAIHAQGSVFINFRMFQTLPMNACIMGRS